MEQFVPDSSGKTGLKARVQRVGGYLSGMIMPNIGALIAWGVLTMLFLETGWIPNEHLAVMIGPMLTYLLPLLIGYTGGNMVYGQRGAVVGAIATMGVIIGAGVTMFLGAMIMGPLGGWVIKKFDDLFAERIPAGFEMLVNNFSAGLLGFGLAVLGYLGVGPVVTTLTEFMGSGVQTIMDANVLPLANIFIDPAKILFLNNAINHGILTPLGVEQSAEAGRSILFLLETNPGPGLGVLLAYTLFGKGAARSSAPGAIIIQFLGGIHEVYFPYVMMKPLLFLAVIAGGVSGSFTFQLFGAGLKAAASPGSIFAIMAMTPRGGYLPVLAGIAVSCAVAFAVSMVILKRDKATEDDFAAAQATVSAAKAESKGQAVEKQETAVGATDYSLIDHIIFACDAGMGSSAMGASIVRKAVKSNGLDITVKNVAINNLTDDKTALIITQEELAERARQKSPSSIHVSVDNFLSSPEYEKVIEKIKESRK